MKRLVLSILVIMMTKTMALELTDLILPGIHQPDPQFIKKEESPWPGDVELITHTIHKKQVELEFTGYKVTDLGYSQITPKVISLELAKHTVMDHRNRGEEGPCLAGEVFFGGGVPAMNATFPLREIVTIELRNQYAINHEKGVCAVSLQELVTVEIDGKKFGHLLSQDMGHRLIDDCTN